ncbi:hypothetical protein ACRALDRAFT_206145 [Sodiomyces alcalophilus JCM 7366]|uniref:uncharacterized protein n=1 Tax=Sodiomyces alcalophilus JCM 7366 TaxID=591952 RepID=UPI0039B38343
MILEVPRGLRSLPSLNNGAPQQVVVLRRGCLLGNYPFPQDEWRRERGGEIKIILSAAFCPPTLISLGAKQAGMRDAMAWREDNGQYPPTFGPDGRCQTLFGELSLLIPLVPTQSSVAVFPCLGLN